MVPRANKAARVSLPLFLATLLLAVPGSLQGQSRTDGSVYSRYGLGERWSFYTSQAQGMGALGTGLVGPAYLNLANPAAYADQVYTRFAAGLDFEGVRSKDSDDQTSISSGGTLGAIQLGFPLIARKLGFAASISPYTTSGYHAQITGQLESDDLEPGTAYEVNFEGDGGLHEATVGLGYQVSPAFSVGATVNAVWGIVEFGQRTEYESTTNFLTTTEQRTSTRMSGFTGGLGVAAKSPRLTGKSDAFTAGVALTFPISVSATRTNLINQGLVLVDTVGVPVEGDLTLPLRLQAGVSYAPSPKWLLAADGIYEPWGDFESDYTLFGYTPGQEDAFNSHFRIGAGMQFLPAGNDIYASKLRRTAYRLGFFIDQSYARPEPDYKLVTYGAAAGFSIPTVIPGTYLDITGQVGMRGEAATNLVQDLLYKFSITLNFGERWFLQRRLR
jgi:hypothetical protein